MFSAILRALPLRCQLCHHRLDQHQYPWCKSCHANLPRPPRCLHCGLPTPYEMESCGRCLKSPPLWNSLSCVSSYTFPYDKLLHRFKYQGHYWLAPSLAKLLATEIDQPAPVLLPVPMQCNGIGGAALTTAMCWRITLRGSCRCNMSQCLKTRSCHSPAAGIEPTITVKQSQ